MPVVLFLEEFSLILELDSFSGVATPILNVRFVSCNRFVGFSVELQFFKILVKGNVFVLLENKSKVDVESQDSHPNLKDVFRVNLFASGIFKAKSLSKLRILLDKHKPIGTRTKCHQGKEGPKVCSPKRVIRFLTATTKTANGKEACE